MTSNKDDDDYWLQTAVKSFNFGSESSATDNNWQQSKKLSPQSAQGKDDVLFSDMLGDNTFGGRSPEGTANEFVISARFRQGSVTDASRFRSPSDTSSSRDFISPSTYPATHVAKLESEIQHLRRTSKALPAIKDVVNQIINDDHYSLEGFRSREQKVALVDAAIKSHDGNAILRTVLHLKHNTNPSIFQQELRSRPDAIEHYLTYLKLHCKYPELIDVLGMFCRNEEAAMVTYQMALSSSHTESAIKAMQNCIQTHFRSEPNLSHETASIQEHINLLGKQLLVEHRDVDLERGGKTEIFKKFPRVKPLPRQSVLDTLHYCCLYHFDLQEHNVDSPLAIKRDHRLTNKQFTFVVLSALADLAEWKRMDSFMFSKGFSRLVKLRPEINMVRLSEMFFMKNIPLEILSKFIGAVDDAEQRFELAKRYNCHEVVIETLVAMKDREQLFRYKNKFPEQSKEWLMADVKLRQNIKWKK